MHQSLAHQITGLLNALRNCQKQMDTHADWARRHGDALDYIEREVLPSGSGFDCGTKIDHERSNDERLILTFEYHHMDENGMYDGWGSYEVWIRASLVLGLDITIKGRNRDECKSYFLDVFGSLMETEIDRNLLYGEKA